MGVSTNAYVIYGVKIEWDSKFAEIYDEMVWSQHNEGMPFALLDGMNGEYIVLGKVLWDSGDFRYGEFNPEGELDLSMLQQYKREYDEQFSNFFPDHAHFLDKEWKIHMFLHYS